MHVKGLVGTTVIRHVYLNGILALFLAREPNRILAHLVRMSNQPRAGSPLYYQEAAVRIRLGFTKIQ